MAIYGNMQRCDMLNEQVIDNLSERLVSRFENVNTTILKKIGEARIMDTL